MRIAKVIKARCTKTGKDFGIRIEQKLPELWDSTWAFPIKENAQVTETYQDKAEGKFKIQETYPGCPHCHQKGIFLCKCNKISCIDFRERHECPWCHSIVHQTQFGPADYSRIEAGGY